jgi:hypothetical protein
MALSRAALEHLSVFHYIKEGPLALNFSQDVIQAPLVYDSRVDKNNTQRTDYKIVDPNSAFAEVAVSKGRGWVSFEPPAPSPCEIYNVSTGEFINIHNTAFEQGSYAMPSERESSLIVVRDQNDVILPRDYYQIDYKSGRIRWPAPTTPSGALSQEPTTIDYRFHLASLIDGYPTSDTPPELPIIALSPLTQGLKPIQIGPGVKFVRKYCLDVFAGSNSELQQIMDLLHTALYQRTAPVIDFNRTGEPLKYWGVINDEFVQDIDFEGNTYRSYLTLNPGNGNVLYFLDIEVMYNTSARQSRSDLVRHVGKITFTTKTFSDRDPRVVGKFSALDEPPGGKDSLLR